MLCCKETLQDFFFEQCLGLAASSKTRPGQRVTNSRLILQKYAFFVLVVTGASGGSKCLQQQRVIRINNPIFTLLGRQRDRERIFVTGITQS